MIARAGRLALLVLGVALASSHARAQPEEELTVAARRLRTRAVSALSHCAAGPLIVRVSVTVPQDAPDRFGLASALLGPTLTALRADERFEPVHVGYFGRDEVHPATQAERLGYRTMLDVQIGTEGGRLAVVAEGWTTTDQTRHERGVVRRPLDASLRRFVGYPPRLTEETVDARFGVLHGRGYVALAAHDLDGDGIAEVVAIHRDDARVYRVTAGRHRHRLEEVGRAAWPDDVPRTTAPRRRVVATAIGRDRAVVVRHSQLAAPIEVRLDGAAVVAARTQGPCPDARFPVQGGCAELVDGRDFFDDILEREGEPYEAAMHFYAFAAGRFAQREPGHSWVEALVNPAGRLVMRTRFEPAEGDPVPHTAGATGYGAALAMADVDVDGAAELLLSHASPEGAGDQLSLLRAFPGGRVRVVWRSEVLPGSVWTAAAGDVDGDGLDELLAIEEPQNPDRGRARLWVIQ